MPVSREGGPANLLKTKNLEISSRDYEPEGWEFESRRPLSQNQNHEELSIFRSARKGALDRV
jgi:hypothetical protein